MLQLAELRLFDRIDLVVGTICLCIAALISRAYLSSTESGLSIPPSPLTSGMSITFVHAGEKFRQLRRLVLCHNA